MTSHQFEDENNHRWQRLEEVIDAVETKQPHEDIERLVQSYALLQVALTSGVYLAAPEAYQQGAGESTLRLLVKQKLSA